MAFLTGYQIQEIRNKLVDDRSKLGKLYKSKRSSFDSRSVAHSEVEQYLAKGWEIEKELVTKTKLRKAKSHSRKFEDDVWCQLYQLGYRILNYDDQFYLPYGKGENDSKQIDVVAINDDSVILVECRSSDRPKRPNSLKTEFESTERLIKGFQKSIHAILGRKHRIRYIFATRNLRIDPEGADVDRLRSAKGFYYNDNTYEYINSLIKNYRQAAMYQFMGIIFRSESVSHEDISIPALRGRMGNHFYYMFSLEPETLLQIGFVLHRTRANEAEMPTYQRLLVPSRLKGIRKFIEDGGYFPNSVIVNFSKNRRIRFEGNPKSKGSRSEYGTLKIPNAYAIAYIIDGQHRVYGYAGTNFARTNTIPVVAFSGLDSVDQLEIFMSINENQKAVSPSLRGTLERDLYWESERADTRLKALRSAIVIDLAESVNGPLYNKIEVGEDPALLKFAPFIKGLQNSGLLPRARGNRYVDEQSDSSFYNIANSDYSQEMQKAKKAVVSFLNLCFEYVEEQFPSVFDPDNSLILTNRGAYAFISLLGSLNHWVVESIDVSVEERFNKIEKYLSVLLEKLSSLSEEEQSEILGSYGTGGDTVWFRTFQMFVHEKFPRYEPIELIEWKERQDKELQDQGRELGVEIEKFLKKRVISHLKALFDDAWELEIGSIKRKCLERAEEEREKRYKEGLGQDEIPWTEMFTIMDYKTIIDKFWTKGSGEIGSDLECFRDVFSIDIGEGIDSKAKAMKWLSRFNSLRNNWAHEGTKEKGLSRDEVTFLQEIHTTLYT